MKHIIVRTRPEAFGEFEQAWTKEVKSIEEANQLIADLEEEDKAYDNYRENYYEIIEF